MQIYLVDAFTTRKYEGNRAGVVLDAENLSSVEMQKMATEINASETAFATRSDEADFFVRFFTPTTEIDFCGHATIALFHTLASRGLIKATEQKKTFTEMTKAGLIEVGVRRVNDLIEATITQNKFSFTPVVQDERLLQAFNITEADLDRAFPVLLVNAANKHLMVPTKLDALSKLKPDNDLLGKLLGPLGAVTAHVFAQKEPTIFQARNFGPHIGIIEDPATGSAAVAFGAYLQHTGTFPDSAEVELLQGYEMGRPSRIKVCTTVESKKLLKVDVTGTAVPSFELIPAAVGLPVAR